MHALSAVELRRIVEPSLLRPEATQPDVEAFCHRAVADRFAVCLVEPCWVRTASAIARGTGLRVGTVAGYPFGASETATKLTEVEAALAAGAQEVDLVMNVGAFRSRADGVVGAEIRAAADRVHALPGRVLKVIVETGYLTTEQVERAGPLIADNGADFVKTGTGYGPRPVTVEDVRRLRAAVGARLRIKAAGGVRTLTEVAALVGAGADRVGSSHAFRILAEALGPLPAPAAAHHPSTQALVGHLDDVR